MRNELKTNLHAIRNSAFLISHSAFTLLELVLVMLILSIMALIVLPSMGPFTRGRTIQDVATNTIALTNFARTQSISQSRIYRLNISETELWLTSEQNGVYDEPTGGMDRHLQIPTAIRMQSDAPKYQDGTYIRFFPTGRSDTAEIRFDTDAIVTRVISGSPTEPYKIVNGD